VPAPRKPFPKQDSKLPLAISFQSLTSTHSSAPTASSRGTLTCVTHCHPVTPPPLQTPHHSPTLQTPHRSSTPPAPAPAPTPCHLPCPRMAFPGGPVPPPTHHRGSAVQGGSRRQCFPSPQGKPEISPSNECVCAASPPQPADCKCHQP